MLFLFQEIDMIYHLFFLCFHSLSLFFDVNLNYFASIFIPIFITFIIEFYQLVTTVLKMIYRVIINALNLFIITDQSQKIGNYKFNLIALRIQQINLQLNQNILLVIIELNTNIYFMTNFNPLIQQLDVSRRLQQELVLEKHRQQLQRKKIERQYQGLRRSRKQFIENQMQSTQTDYEKRLEKNPGIAQEHLQRENRLKKEKSKVAQQDFQKQRQRLLEERSNHDILDKQYRNLDKKLSDLQQKSQNDNDQEVRRLRELQNRRKVITKLLQESKRKELQHYDKAKSTAAQIDR